LLCNKHKLADLVNKKENTVNCDDIFSITWFLFPKAYADDGKEEKITYENLTISGSIKPPFEIYSQLKDECFAQEVKDKKHCIKTWLSIAYAECTWRDLKTPFWLQSKDKSYKKWVKSYKKYWYKAKDWHFFYWDWWELGKSHYCTEEESSWSKVWCPNGRKNFNRIFNNLTF
jgi:hypothetical protein